MARIFREDFRAACPPASGSVEWLRLSAVVLAPQGPGRRRKPHNRFSAPGVWPWSAAGGLLLRQGFGGQAAFRFGRVAPADPRASRRLCRTRGLPESRKSPAKWIVFVRRRSRGPVRPDPAAGFERRNPRRKNLPFARVEIRSRPAYPVPAAVGGCRAKHGNKEMAVSFGDRAKAPGR